MTMTSIQLSAKQDRALSAVSQWHSAAKSGADQQVFRLFGPAGTGKSFLARRFAEGAGDVLFAAYTGKAADVMRRYGCEDATTIHSLIYLPKDRSRARLRELQEELDGLLAELRAETAPDEPTPETPRTRSLRALIEAEKEVLKRPAFALNPDSPVRGADLLVVDEVSMVGELMGEHLLSFGTPILVLGDPFQLPPVGSTGYFTNAKPDVLLDEIHRQARDNPILRMADKIRNGGDLEIGEDYGESRVIDWGDIEESDALDADQILVGKNTLRRSTNKRMRDLLGRRSQYPEKGDRLVCLRNNHEQGLLNGGIWHVEHAIAGSTHVAMTVKADAEDKEVTCEAHIAPFEGRDLDLEWWERKEAEEFDYGYALTVHKSQGSQFENVLIFDQSRVFRDHARRWLYTAVTRASERVTVVQ